MIHRSLLVQILGSLETISIRIVVEDFNRAKYRIIFQRTQVKEPNPFMIYSVYWLFYRSPYKFTH